MAWKTSKTEKTSQLRKGKFKQRSTVTGTQFTRLKGIQAGRRNSKYWYCQNCILSVTVLTHQKSQELPISDPWVPSTADSEAQHYQGLSISGQLFIFSAIMDLFVQIPKENLVEKLKQNLNSQRNKFSPILLNKSRQWTTAEFLDNKGKLCGQPPPSFIKSRINFSCS